MKIIHRPTGIIRVVLTLILVIPYLLATTTATASATTTIASNEAGAANVTYTVNPTNHEIDWQVRMTKEKSEAPRSMRLNLAKGARLTEVTDFAVTSDSGQAVAFTTERAGSSYRGPKDADAKQYLATFKTKYEEGVTSDAALTIGYDIFEEADGQAVQNVLTGMKQVQISVAELIDPENEVEKETNGDDATSTQVSESPSTSPKSDYSTESEQGTIDDRTTNKDSRAWDATGIVLVNDSETKMNFETFWSWQSASNNSETNVGTISYRDKVRFTIKWDSLILENTLSYRTVKGGAWTEIARNPGSGNYDDEIKLEDLEGNTLDQIRAVKNTDGSLTFTNEDASNEAMIQFKAAGPLFRSESNWMKFTSSGEKFKLTVPKLDFGTIDKLGQITEQPFVFDLEQNTGKTPFSLKATNQADTMPIENPFRQLNALTSGSKTLNPGETQTILENQVDEIPPILFGINVPDVGYLSENYSAPIRWDLVFK